MDIIGKCLLEEFWQQYPRAKNPIMHWVKVVEKAKWHKWHDIKQTFNHADLVHINNERYVIFNISGIKYRVVTAVDYIGRLVVIEVALTHDEYNKGGWKYKL